MISNNIGKKLVNSMIIIWILTIIASFGSMIMEQFQKEISFSELLSTTKYNFLFLNTCLTIMMIYLVISYKENLLQGNFILEGFILLQQLLVRNYIGVILSVLIIISSNKRNKKITFKMKDITMMLFILFLSLIYGFLSIRL